MLTPRETLQRASGAPPSWPTNLHTVSEFKRHKTDWQVIAAANDLPSHIPASTEPSRARLLNTVSRVSATGRRTTGDQGLSEAEIERIRAVLERWCRRNEYVVFWTLGDALRDMPEAEARELIRRALNTLRTAQTRADIKPEYMVVLEVTGGLHAHILGPASPKIMKALRRSEKFAPFMIRPSRAVRPVTNAYGFAHLADVYLVKETGDPAYALPPGGGDRVVVSPTLKANMMEEGWIDDWKRSTSRNLKPTPPKPARSAKQKIEVQPAPAPRQDEPILLSVPPTPTPSPLLFSDLPEQRLVSPRELQAFREHHGISQAEIAILLRVSDRSHIANFERGHDAFSLPRLRILRNFIDTYQPRRLAA